jgi:hypothetical protein
MRNIVPVMNNGQEYQVNVPRRQSETPFDLVGMHKFRSISYFCWHNIVATIYHRLWMHRMSNLEMSTMSHSGTLTVG